MTSPQPSPDVVFTIGHSNRPLDDFLELLGAWDIKLLADVRKLPGSRAHPHFGGAELAKSLKGRVEYVHFPALGGLRRGRPDSPNTGWRNASFRAYADYMQTEEFAVALAELLTLAAESRTAIMCAEAVPWRCHRSLIADALVVRGVGVEHILSKTRAEKHSLKAWALVEGTQITYPGPPAESSGTLF